MRGIWAKGFPSRGEERPSRAQSCGKEDWPMPKCNERRFARARAPAAFARVRPSPCDRHTCAEVPCYRWDAFPGRSSKIIRLKRCLGGFLLLSSFSINTVQALQSVTLAWDPNSETNLVGYVFYHGTASGQYSSSNNVGNATNTTVSGLQEGGTYFFAVTAYDNSGLESDPSNEVSYTVPGSGNQAPTLNALNNLSTNENAGLQTVDLTGITSGATNEIQALTVTARSSNPGLIPNPIVNSSICPVSALRIRIPSWAVSNSRR